MGLCFYGGCDEINPNVWQGGLHSWEGWMDVNDRIIRCPPERARVHVGEVGSGLVYLKTATIYLLANGKHMQSCFSPLVGTSSSTPCLHRDPRGEIIKPRKEWDGLRNNI